jgi:hypothetical protein
MTLKAAEFEEEKDSWLPTESVNPSSEYCLVSTYRSGESTGEPGRSHFDLLRPASRSLFHQAWREVGGSTFLEAEFLLHRLRRAYVIEDETKVKAWFERRPDTGDAVLMSSSTIRGFFPDAELRLEVRQDPDDMTPPRMVIYIECESPPSECVDRFMDLDSQWGQFLDRSTDGAVMMNIEAKC